MDPNAALAEIRRLINELDDLADDEVAETASLASQVVMHVDALDQWLSKGGFLPDEWDAAQRADQIIRIIFTTSDIEQMAEDAGVDPALAVQRATEWGRHITDTAAQLCDEQLQSCIENDTP